MEANTGEGSLLPHQRFINSPTTPKIIKRRTYTDLTTALNIATGLLSLYGAIL
jgi:hypothetical protein